MTSEERSRLYKLAKMLQHADIMTMIPPGEAPYVAIKATPEENNWMIGQELTWLARISQN